MTADTPDEPTPDPNENSPPPEPDAAHPPDGVPADSPSAEAHADVPVDGAEAEIAVAATPAIPESKHWYIVKVQSGREESIKGAIERRVKIEGLEEFFGGIKIPMERV